VFPESGIPFTSPEIEPGEAVARIRRINIDEEKVGEFDGLHPSFRVPDRMPDSTGEIIRHASGKRQCAAVARLFRRIPIGSVAGG